MDIVEEIVAAKGKLTTKTWKEFQEARRLAKEAVNKTVGGKIKNETIGRKGGTTIHQCVLEFTEPTALVLYIEYQTQNTKKTSKTTCGQILVAN